MVFAPSKNWETENAMKGVKYLNVVTILETVRNIPPLGTININLIESLFKNSNTKMKFMISEKITIYQS